jgi:hypothetical protein
MLQLQIETCKSTATVDFCPFEETKTNICMASLSAMVIGPSNKQEYCSNDNYDNCPIFLAKSLRRR